MTGIAKSSKKSRDKLFTNTSVKLNINPAIIEKDFWVCYLLDYLFNRSWIKDEIAFKGGTSLSKCYKLIRRFSEDIDLILNWEVLGYFKNEPWNKRTNRQQDIFNKKINEETQKYLNETFVPKIKEDLSKELEIKINCYIDNDDKQTVIVEYPNTFRETSIIPKIRLEIGALAAWTQCQEQTIMSLCAEVYSKIFKKPTTKILSVSPERTFWEKITILHKEANRPATSKLPKKYSRHYYDVYCMYFTQIKNSSFSKIDLLKTVVEFKEKFYKCSWAKYEEARVGSIKLLPNMHFIDSLKKDYEHMSNMIYGNKPSFDDIIKVIRKLEKEINTLL